VRRRITDWRSVRDRDRDAEWGERQTARASVFGPTARFDSAGAEEHTALAPDFLFTPSCNRGQHRAEEDSTMTPSTIGLALGPASRGMPMTPYAETLLTRAVKNGETSAFVQQQWALNSFYQYMNELSDWPMQQTGQNYPFFFFQAEDGYLLTQCAMNEAVIQGETPPAGFEYGGSTYNIVGMLTVTIGYSEQPLWYIEAPVGVVESVAIPELASLAWSNLLQPIMRNFLGSIRQCLSSGMEAESQEDVAEGAAEAADDAAIEAEEVGEVVISLDVGVGALIGIALLVALPFLLSFLFHTTYHNLQVYNLTSYDLYWNTEIAEGVMSQYPVGGQDTTTPDFTIPAMTSYAPPGLNPVPVATNADFSFASTSDVTGINYRVFFNFLLAGTNEAVGGAMAWITVPYWGDNLISISQGGAEPEATLAMQCELLLSPIPLGGNISMDALDGKQPTPSGGSAYMYNSVVVFSNG
jgi:hypothetical protein